MTDLRIKRVFHSREPADGYRVLVDKFWPRGLAKSRAGVDEWLKQIAPDDSLRRDFHDGRIQWNEFRRRYLGQLARHRETLRPLALRAQRQPVTLLFASRNEAHNNAVVVRQYLRMLAPR